MIHLPEGYIALKSDFGATLKDKRRAKRLKQASLAEDLGIPRETLSRVENGRVPRGELLLALLSKLEMDISKIAKPGRAKRHLAFTGRARGDDLLAAGEAIRQKRRRLKMSLEAAAQLTGLSAATLSRLERSQSPRSRVFEDVPAYADMAFEDRQVELAHPGLRLLLEMPV